VYRLRSAENMSHSAWQLSAVAALEADGPQAAHLKTCSFVDNWGGKWTYRLDMIVLSQELQMYAISIL